jgi:putative sigma-54 modulation protein
MKIQVKTVNLDLDARTRADVQRMMQAHLGRLAHRVLRVNVRLADQNGPRGGKDISCLVEARLRPRGRLFIEEIDSDLMGAVSRSAEAAATTVSRTLERSRDLRRRPSTRPALGTSGLS